MGSSHSIKGKKIPDLHFDELSEEMTLARARAELKTQQSSNDFPVEAFPPAIRKVIDHWRVQYQLPAEYLGAGVLTAASVALGNAFTLEYAIGFRQSPILYMALVGAPGMGKTPAINLALEPVHQVEKALRNHFQQQLIQWECECETVSDTERKKMESLKPKCKDLIINDATMEAINQALNRYPRGLLYSRDELNAWVNSMNQYRKGADLEFWLTAWTNSPGKVSRVNQDSLYIPRPFLSVIGGIQPAILQEMCREAERDSGLLVRILFAYPANQDMPPAIDPTPDPKILESYNDIIRRLFELPNRLVPPMKAGGDWIVDPVLITMSYDARKKYQEYHDELSRLGNKTDNEILRGLYVKLQAYCMRFSLILHLLGLVCQSAGAITLNELEKQRISSQTVESAIRLCRYFTVTATRVIEACEDPISRLSAKPRALYHALQGTFRTDLAMKVAKQLGISEATVRRLLNNRKLFRRIAHGLYEKLLL